MHTLAQVLPIWGGAPKSKTGQHISQKLCTYVPKPFSTFISQKKIKNIPAELNINWDAHVNFLSVWSVLMHCMGRGLMQEKITSNS